MSQSTDRRTSLSTGATSWWPDSGWRVPAAAGNWLFSGVMAAGLGLTALMIPVLLLWTISPYPDSGLSAAFQLAADLWLLAHGVELVRPGTAGGSAPLGLPPLLLTALPVVLLHRAARSALIRPPESRLAAVGWLSGGYLLLATAVVVFASAGPLCPVPHHAALLLPLFVVVVTAIGVRAGRRPHESALAGTRTAAALRAAVVGTGTLCGAGALLATGSLIWHAEAMEASFAQLTDVWSGQLGVLALAVALAPNAAVWGASYGLGPGFALGTGNLVTPLGTSEVPETPYFPLLAAVPEGPLDWAQPLPLVCAFAVPVVAALAMGGSLARSAVPVSGGGVTDYLARRWGETAVTAVLAALGCAGLTALLAAFAGGPLGRGSLADFGPHGWLTGLAALGWTVGLAVPAALLLRARRLSGGWRLRRQRAAQPPQGPDGWHATAARQLRWQALRTASGGLMARFEPQTSLVPLSEEPSAPQTTADLGDPVGRGDPLDPGDPLATRDSADGVVPVDGAAPVDPASVHSTGPAPSPQPAGEVLEGAAVDPADAPESR